MALEHPDFSTMTDAEIADWQYAHRDELDEALDSDDYDTVEAEPAKDVATVTSFRMPPGELEQIRLAAKVEGVTMSEWIRNACKAALGRPAPAPDRAHIIELLDVLRRTVEEADRTVRGQLGQSSASSTLTAERAGGREDGPT
jgi:hypothetical protein